MKIVLHLKILQAAPINFPWIIYYQEGILSINVSLFLKNKRFNKMKKK
jgi:hypothetical protein